MTSATIGRHLPKIIVDIGPLFEDHWTGIPIFTRRLVQSLIRDGNVEVEFAFRLSKLPKSVVMAAIQTGTGTFIRGDFERNAVQRYPLIDPATPILYPSVKEFFAVAAREASTIHDVSSLFMPEYHESTNVDYHMKHLARQLSTDEVVFCVSQATAVGLSQAFPSVSKKIRLLPQYVDWPDSFAAMERNLPPPLFGRFVAVIGTIEPRKNLALLIRALREPQVRDSDLRFVVMGKKGWKVEQFMSDLTDRDRERLLFLGYVTEFMKYRLLRHAEFLVFPSLYEGFGIPALEAMSLGKPVLASITSSFAEVVGEAGVYFDPLSVSDFADAFKEISHEKKLSELSVNASHESTRYTSQKMAEPIVQWIKDQP